VGVTTGMVHGYQGLAILSIIILSTTSRYAPAMPARPDLIILGGPNGAGKTTFARVLLPEVLGLREFVNADEIARGLSPFDPEGAAVAAARVMIERIRHMTATGTSFAIETTCAGLTHLRTIARCRAAGYRVTLIFLWLPAPEDAIARVALRVAEGGHDVPAATIRRRHGLGLRNLVRGYLPLVDHARIFDNSMNPPLPVAHADRGQRFRILDGARWTRIEDAAR